MRTTSEHREPPISFRPRSPDDRALLEQRAQQTGGTVSSIAADLIAEGLAGAEREASLLGALQQFRSVTVEASTRGARLIDALPRRDDGERDFGDIALPEVRERGGRLLVEIVGVAEFAGSRLLLGILPTGRRVRMEFDPRDLGPNLTPYPS